MSSKNERFVFSHGTGSLHNAVTTTNMALFFPSNSQVSRPMRAWERKQTTAFVNDRSRTRKIWKRAPIASAEKQQRSSTHAAKPRHDSPKNAKRVKRRCVSSDEAVSTQWELLSSPVKRITTRSWLSKELVALPEYEGSHNDEDSEAVEIEGTIIEIVNDDGTLIKLDNTEGDDAEGWADEEEYNDTLMHLEDAVSHESIFTDTPAEAASESKDDDESPAYDTELADESSDKYASKLPTEDLNTTLPTYAIPAGFVSPVKRNRSVSKRLKESGRRQTLPQAFAPIVQLLKTHPPKAQLMIAPGDVGISSDRHEPGRSSPALDTACDEPLAVNEVASEEDWEDVEGVSGFHPIINTSSQELVAEEALQTCNMDDYTSYDKDPTPHLPANRAVDPIPGFKAVRRSPRRKSSSPIKARKALTSHETSHILAFTPIKMATTLAVHQSTSLDSPVSASPRTELIPQTPPSLLRLSESSVQQVRRAEKSRLSDDTALLQAFLDRAARNKQSGAQSAENRMEQKCSSSTTRQASASPVSLGVLHDLDPNTALPRKALGSPTPVQHDDAKNANELDDTDSDADGSSSRTTLNRRDTRRSERIMTTAPAKITLRGIQGIQESLASKRTPAKELFLLTGKNTRANKADAVPPARRVPTLMAEMLEIGSVSLYPTLKSTKKKTVTWDKAPVYFNFDTFEDDADLDSAETGLQPQGDSTAATELEEGKRVTVEPLKRRATPGKPRVRQLRAPSVSTNIPASTNSAQIHSASETTGRTTFRSNTVTPLKRISLAAPDKATTGKTGIPSIAGQLKSRRKMPSRLPAPVSILDTSSTTSLSAPESIAHASIMSPPKRRASLFTPNFEIAAVKMDPAASATQPPRLTSPAKKPRRAFLIDNENQGSKPEEVNTKAKVMPGLSSPAKKRARKIY